MLLILTVSTIKTTRHNAINCTGVFNVNKINFISFSIKLKQVVYNKAVLYICR